MEAVVRQIQSALTAPTSPWHHTGIFVLLDFLTKIGGSISVHFSTLVPVHFEGVEHSPTQLTPLVLIVPGASRHAPIVFFCEATGMLVYNCSRDCVDFLENDAGKYVYLQKNTHICQKNVHEIVHTCQKNVHKIVHNCKKCTRTCT